MFMSHYATEVCKCPGQHQDIDKRQGQDDDRYGIGSNKLTGNHAVYGAVQLDDDARKNGGTQVTPEGMANDM